MHSVHGEAACRVRRCARSRIREAPEEIALVVTGERASLNQTRKFLGDPAAGTQECDRCLSRR